MRILLIEPNRMLAASYVTALQQDGHEVAVSRDAQVAINRADSVAPELVIAELQLKGHSGIEFMYEFRSYGDWQTVPVIVLSSVPRAEIAGGDDVLKELGINDYLYKPETSLMDIRRAVQRIGAMMNSGQTTQAGHPGQEARP
jgi:DNA-binding response OmpR family regulator